MKVIYYNMEEQRVRDLDTSLRRSKHLLYERNVGWQTVKPVKNRANLEPLPALAPADCHSFERGKNRPRGSTWRNKKWFRRNSKKC